MRQLSLTLSIISHRLHAIDYQSAGLGELGKPVGYVRDRYRLDRSLHQGAGQTMFRKRRTSLPGLRLTCRRNRARA